MGLFGRRKKEADRPSGDRVVLDNGEAVSVTTVVDCIGDSCPRPQLLTRGALGKAGSGDVIKVMVDNPTSMWKPSRRSSKGTTERISAPCANRAAGTC